MFVLNRCIQISLIQTQSRILSLPSWAKGQCTSAGPARCIPSKANDGYCSLLSNRASSRGGKIASESSMSSGPGSASVDSRFPTEKAPGAAEFRLEELEYDDLDPADESDYESPNGSRIKENVKKKAIELLAVRAFSASALRKKLMGKKFPIEVINSVIADLQDRELLNDSLYAETFSRSRWLSLSWGPRKIKRALLEKGISQEDANRATCHVFEDEDLSEDGHNMHFGMSKLNLDRLFEQASKQWLRSREKTLNNRKSSVVRWLQYRGFGWGVTKFILKKLETEHPA